MNKSILSNINENLSDILSIFENQNLATKDYVESLYTKLNTNTVLGFYCVEDVTVNINGIAHVYPANSNVEIKFIEGDTFEIVPTSDNSILSLSAFPGALGTYYPWLEGVKQFSNILFDMNAEDMYTKWSQGQQGSYQVQFAQYVNCVFWSDLPYISEVTKRTNYTLYYSAQLPLCYSSIPENTFKSFYLATGVTTDPNWANPTYRESFANATWATQAFSYYGARTIGLFGHDHPDFNIVLPKDCRGLMYDATAVENAGTFDAVNTTNFGAKSGSWRDAFGNCGALRNLYIKNLKVSLNISWSPINYESISYILSEAANTSAITISVSPHTYNLLKSSDFELASSKNITIELLTTNYVEDRRLTAIKTTGDGSKVLSNDGTYKDLPVKTSQLENDSNFITDEYAKEKDLIVTFQAGGKRYSTHSVAEINEAVAEGRTVKFLQDGEYLDLLEVTADFATFYIFYVNINNKIQQKIVALSGTDVALLQDDTYDFATTDKLKNYYSKTEIDAKIAPVINEQILLKTAQTLTDEELTQVRSNLKFIGKDVAGKTFTINGASVTASANAEIFGDYDNNIAVGQWSIAEGSQTVAKGRASHAEGALTQALSDGSHTEGYNTKATGYWSHAEGEMTTVSSYASHAEGSYCTLPDGAKRYGTASGYASHVEGGGCHTTGSCTHAEGLATTASGAQSHVEGRYTIAAGGAQHVEGIANIEDTSDTYIHIAGNGSYTERSNAYTLDWNGNGWFSGDVYVGSTSGTNKDEGSKKLATEDFVRELVGESDSDTMPYVIQASCTEGNLIKHQIETEIVPVDETTPYVMIMWSAAPYAQGGATTVNGLQYIVKYNDGSDPVDGAWTGDAPVILSVDPINKILYLPGSAPAASSDSTDEHYTYSDTDIIPGVTELATGMLYFVYE